MNDLTTRFAKSLYDQFLLCCNLQQPYFTYRYLFKTIQCIDGIQDIYAYLLIERRQTAVENVYCYSVDFCIQTFHLYDRGTTPYYLYALPLFINEPELTLDLVLRSVQIIQHKLEHVRFHRYLNEFVDETFIEEPFEMKYANPNECCICYEKTNQKTICNHSICIECLRKHKRNNRGCPYCRHEPVYLQSPIHDGLF
jgi:hypothetical protein